MIIINRALSQKRGEGQIKKGEMPNKKGKRKEKKKRGKNKKIKWEKKREGTMLLSFYHTCASK